MAIRQFAPTSPGRRFMTVAAFDEITEVKPLKSLLEPKQRCGGRNNKGHITIWHRGGGHKRMYRVIDFRRDKADIPATVVSIEYDPNRSDRIARLHYADGEKRYIVAPLGLTVGQKVIASANADIQIGNVLPLKNIPLGTMVHNVELKPGRGAQMVRSAGGAAQMLAKEG